ncbi:unnamed protein product, partial [Bubo scandiacus]
AAASAALRRGLGGLGRDPGDVWGYSLVGMGQQPARLCPPGEPEEGNSISAPGSRMWSQALQKRRKEENKLLQGKVEGAEHVEGLDEQGGGSAPLSAKHRSCSLDVGCNQQQTHLLLRGPRGGQ